MRVLYCNPSFWEYRLPFYAELNRLLDGNFHVIYSTKRYQAGHTDLLGKIKRTLGDNAHPWDSEWLYDSHTRAFGRFTEGKPHTSFPFGLWKRISRIRPDVLITEGFMQWTPIVQLYALTHRIPVFMGYEKTPWTERNNSRMKNLKRQWQDRAFTGYFVNGSETRKYLESIGVASSKIHIGGMSADSSGLRSDIARLDAQSRAAFKARFCPEGRGLVYLFSGRVEELKGAPHLVRAWMKHTALHPDDALVLIGMGDKFDELKADYGHCPRLFLEGRVPYDEVHKYYAAADVFILPTLLDNWSLVVPEAMACSLPVATSIYNGCHPELIKEGENGTVFDPLQEESLLRALDYFHHVDLRAHGARSAEIEREWSTERCAQRVFQCLERYAPPSGKPS